MPRSLPSRPDLDHLKNEAKTLLAAHPPGETSLQKVQHALARDYGFSNWKALRDHVEAATAERRARLDAIAEDFDHESVKVRMRALRRYAATIHPDWSGHTGFGWGLAERARRAPASVARLTGFLGDDSWRVRREMVSALAAYGHLGHPEVDRALQTALGDERHAVVHAAARALSIECPSCGDSPALSEYVPDRAHPSTGT